MTFFRRAPSVPAVALSTLFFVLALSGAAHAQRTAEDIASARRLYNEGIGLRDEGDMKGALEKFKAAHALGHTPLTGIELCRAYAALSQPIEAREVCLGVGRIAPLPEESQRSKDARSDAARLAEAERSKIGAIRIKVTGVPEGWQPTVVVDGATVPVAALNEPRSVNPGVHAISVKVGSGPETRAVLETGEGETKDLELEVEPPPEGEPPEPSLDGPAPMTPEPPPRPKKSSTLAAVSFTVAGLSTIVGSVAGLSAMTKENELESECKRKICGRAQWDALDSAKTAGNVSTVFFVVAGVAGITGIVAAIASGSSTSGSPPSPAAKARASTSAIEVTPVVGLGGAGLYGSF